jgi:hypothetical protein
MNGNFHQMRSSDAHAWLLREPVVWSQYHQLYREARSSWTEVPAHVIAGDLRRRVDLVIGDFGCGECLLAEALPEHQVVGFDHISIDDRVIPCNMTRTPLDEARLDVAVFCLSLWGPMEDVRSYLMEAARTVKPLGFLRVAEPASRWEGRLTQLLTEIQTAGFDLVGKPRDSGPFVYLTAIRR